MLYDNWIGVLRVLVVGPLAYAGLLLMLRISGNRTLSKMNAFDLIVTVALGSTLATVLLTEEVALVEGLSGFAVLILMQWSVARLSVRWHVLHRVFNAEPRLLVLRGKMLKEAMRRERVTEEEVLAMVRSKGLGTLERVEAVILETNGQMSVVPASKTEDPASALCPVSGFS